MNNYPTTISEKQVKKDRKKRFSDIPRHGERLKKLELILKISKKKLPSVRLMHGKRKRECQIRYLGWLKLFDKRLDKELNKTEKNA